MKLSTKPLQTDLDALTLFEQLVSQHENCFLLETLEDKDQPQTSHQSYIGIAPKRVFTAMQSKLDIDGVKVTTDNPFFELRNHLKIDNNLDPGYIGGLVGYFSHEGIHYLEPSLRFSYKRLFPDFQFGEYTDGVVYSPGEPINYFYQDEDRSAQYLENNSQKPSNLSISFEKADKTESEHAEIVEKARDDIQNGRVFQVVLANKYSYKYSGDLINLYRELRNINPSPFMFFMKFGDYITLGASPELLAHTKPNGDVFLEALAGTIRRGVNELEDERLATFLLADEKEVAEHSMLVDLARNDVGRISKIGSVSIENLMYVKRLSHVQHICSIVKGKLMTGKDMFDSLAASFPAGTLSGAPKIEAIKMIAELEGVERGPYGGTIGYFSYNGDSMHAVNIRSISAFKNQLFLQSGSGIVFDSKPQREYEEISEKKEAMDRAISQFSVGEER